MSEKHNIVKKYACPYCNNKEILALRNGVKKEEPWEGNPSANGWYVGHVCPVCAKTWTYHYEKEQVNVA